MASDPATAAAASADDIMSAAEMRPLLAKAKRGGAINCVIAMAKDKSVVILLDRKRQPKKLVSMLKKQSRDIGLDIVSTSLRWGSANVDSDADPNMVKFVLNKEAPGAMWPMILEQVKKAGFRKIDVTAG